VIHIYHMDEGDSLLRLLFIFLFTIFLCLFVVEIVLLTTRTRRHNGVTAQQASSPEAGAADRQKR